VGGTVAARLIAATAPGARAEVAKLRRMRVAAIVLGAGSGARLRAELGAAPPKALVALGGVSLLARSLAALARVREIEWLQPVLPADALAAWSRVRAELPDAARVLAPVAGGAERQDSAQAGLAALPDVATHVAIHDAARPLVRPEDVARVIAAALAHGAAILAEPVRDTIHRVAAGRIVATPPRAECVAAQTPQVFRIDWLREAYAKARADGIVGSDDAALVARLGNPVEVVVGDPGNFKITTAADLARAEALLAGAR
jgi:2-C-methyl-D-erythritol 4-phosphate cytidylyltransferase